MILPDHPTPIKIKTHTSTPVPYILYDSRKIYTSNYSTYNEITAKQGNSVINGYDLIKLLLEK